jgi:hypothetical protein
MVRLQKPIWTMRRRIISATLIWCGGLVTYVALFVEPTTLAETVVSGCLVLMGTVITGYVGGAVWDDRNYMALSKGAPPEPKPPKGMAE